MPPFKVMGINVCVTHSLKCLTSAEIISQPLGLVGSVATGFGGCVTTGLGGLVTTGLGGFVTFSSVVGK